LFLLKETLFEKEINPETKKKKVEKIKGGKKDDVMKHWDSS
jgi:hypothetical protein